MTDEVHNPRIRIASLESEVSNAFLDYAMSVIVDRALPDVRDGLKPVHRRIVYAMHDSGYTPDKKHRKCAAIVGDVMGKFHPHGDSAIYEALVRLAQPWSVRHVLVDGQGNFGNRDGDSAAAMRYTEARMSRLARELTADIDKSTVAFRDTYDGSNQEPVVLPARFPNVLVNGSIGIAVGMATNIPTHNLAEALNAALLVLDKPTATLEEIMAVMPGPDFPTAGVIMGRTGIRKAYETGSGSFMISGVATIEPGKRGKQQIIINELPYLVVKERFVGHIAELVRDKKLEGITDVRDESDRNDPVRVMIEVRADSDPSIVLNGLRRMTDFQKNFSYNGTCLNTKGKPLAMPVLDMLREFVDFRRHVVRARTMHDLDKFREQQGRQIGLYAAVSLIDEVVRVIRSSTDGDEARVRLMAINFPADAALNEMILESDPDAVPGDTFRLSDVQADAILALNLRSLTGMERDKIVAKAKTYAAEIRGLVEILANPVLLDSVVRNEMIEVREKYGVPRLTRLEASEADDIEDEALVERKDVVVTLTNSGYVKRTELDTYRAQKRGGKGRTGMETKDDDFVVSTIVCTTRTPLLVFTSRGHSYGMKAFRLPEAAANAKGRPIVNYLKLVDGERVTSIVPLPEDRASFEDSSLIFVTDFGTVRRNSVTDFLDIKSNGKMAMKLESEDGSAIGRLVAVLLAGEEDDVFVATASAGCIRFPVTDVRIFQGRDSQGNRAISLKDRDQVVSACILRHSDATPLERDAYLGGGTVFLREKDLLNEQGERRPVAESITLTPAPDAERPDRLMANLSALAMERMRSEELMILTVTENGMGKRSSSHDYRVTSRGGSGMTAAVINEVTGKLVSCLPAGDEDGLVLVTDGGQTIRTQVSGVAVQGRNTRGVRLLSIPDGQRVVGVARVPKDEDETDATPAAANDAVAPATTESV